MINKAAHISIDDVTCAMQRLSIGDYSSIWDDKLFRYLRVLHWLYGLKITLYLYAQYGDWSITKMPDRYKREFEDASNWLKFGFHAVSDKQKENNLLANFAVQYQLTIQQIKRFAGGRTIAKILRLHYWFYPKEYAKVLKENEVKCVLVKSDCNAREIDGISTWRTQIRIEQDSNIINKICRYRELEQPLVIFTHEWALNRKNKVKFALAVLFLKLQGYKFICE